MQIKWCVWRQSGSNCEYVYSMHVSIHVWAFLCMCTHVTRSIWLQSCHLEHQVSAWHMHPHLTPHLLPPAAFAATVLLSCDTPVHLNGTLNFLSVSAVTLSGLTNSGCGDRMTNHEIHLSRCSISKEINFCDQCLIVSLCRYIMNWQICNPVNQRRGRWCNWHKLDLWFQLLIALPLSLSDVDWGWQLGLILAG